jgi:RNA polymerase sigma-70 factor (ECF subfamily)
VDRSDRNAAEIEALYRLHGAALVLFAVSIVGERASAQDVVHQVFLKLMQHDGLQSATDKKAYLFACVRNAAFNEQKLQARNIALDPDSVWLTSVPRDLAEEANLKHALVALPEDQREVIVLHIWGELTFSQIGDVLGLSSNTAASRYRYALAKLRSSMSTKENSCANFRG